MGPNTLLAVLLLNQSIPFFLLFQAMLNPDYRRRPIAAAIMNHQFMTLAFR